MKITLLVLSLLLALTLVGCNDKTDEHISHENPITTPDESTSEVKEEGYYLIFKDTKISVNAEVNGIVDALGEPTSYFESNSCAFQGLDKVYTYGSVIVRTYPNDDVDYVMSIELKDDSVQTPEGVCIGNTADFVKSVYGEPDQDSDTSLVYKKGDTNLSFIIKNNEVSAITYTQNN